MEIKIAQSLVDHALEQWGIDLVEEVNKLIASIQEKHPELPDWQVRHLIECALWNGRREK